MSQPNEPDFDDVAAAAHSELHSTSQSEYEELFLDAAGDAFYSSPDNLRMAVDEAIDAAAEGEDYTDQCQEIGEAIINSMVVALYRSRFKALP